MSNRLNGKTAVITGGAKGLGRSIAEKFYEEGCEIIICDVLSLDPLSIKIISKHFNCIFKSFLKSKGKFSCSL